MALSMAGLEGFRRVELGGPLECRRSGGEVPQQKMIVEIVRQKEPDNPKYPGGSGCFVSDIVVLPYSAVLSFHQIVEVADECKLSGHWRFQSFVL